jgi:hypothetical protein
MEWESVFVRLWYQQRSYVPWTPDAMSSLYSATVSASTAAQYTQQHTEHIPPGAILNRITTSFTLTAKSQAYTSPWHAVDINAVNDIIRLAVEGIDVSMRRNKSEKSGLKGHVLLRIAAPISDACEAEMGHVNFPRMNESGHFSTKGYLKEREISSSATLLLL